MVNSQHQSYVYVVSEYIRYAITKQFTLENSCSILFLDYFFRLAPLVAS